MINSVRNTVLSVLNKNNYGYISPADFNLYAKQAQMELFEDYFSAYNKTISMENARMAGTDYANRERPLAEALELFLTSDFLVPALTPSGAIINQYYAPSVITVGYDHYMINRLLCYTNVLTSGLATATLPADKLTDAGANFIAAGVQPGDIVVDLDTLEAATVTAVAATVLDLSVNIVNAIGDAYVVYSSSVTSTFEAEKVSIGKVALLNASLYTAPTNVFPIYTLNNSGTITVYPRTISGYGAVEATYFRYPRDPKWTYITLISGEPVFDQSQPDYSDFELPIEDEYKLVIKILSYCGVSIREGEVVQYAIGQETENKTNG
jgi:hypothetical protein